MAFAVYRSLSVLDSVIAVISDVVPVDFGVVIVFDFVTLSHGFCCQGPLVWSSSVNLESML